MTYAQLHHEEKTHAVRDMHRPDGGIHQHFHGKSLCGMLANWHKVVSGPATCKRCREVEGKARR